MYDYNLKIAKFGGSSLADAGQITKVKNIVLADPARRYVVPSAPGKRFKDDTKITDSLYNLMPQLPRRGIMKRFISLSLTVTRISATT